MTPATAEITGISSMATRAVLADLARAYEVRAGCVVTIESVGGVDATRRVQAGEAFDVVVLASDAIDKLLATGHLVAGSKADFVRSEVAVAVRAGAARPDLADEAALKRAVLGARTIGYSTGPSGVRIAELFRRWGIADALRSRIVTPPPGVPVARLLAQGEVELGFQQRSELIRVDGIEVVGPLPPSVQIVTTFSVGLGAHARQPNAARALLAFLVSRAAADAKRHEGMEPA